MVTCEICGRREAEADALVDGEYKQICRQCAAIEDAVIVEKPSQQQISMTDRRPKVRQVLSRMAGLNRDNYSPESKPSTRVRNPYAGLRIPAARKNVSLDDLREVKKDKEAEEKELNAEVGQIEDVEAEIEEKKEKVQWFGRILGLFKSAKKEKSAEVQPVETVQGNAADEERVTKVRVIDSR